MNALLVALAQAKRVLAGAEIPRSEVLPLIRFALELAGFAMLEAPGGEVRIERAVATADACGRERASVPAHGEWLSRRAGGGRVSFRFVDAPAPEVVSAMANLLKAVVVYVEVPTARLSLGSGQPVAVGDAYRELAAALEGEGLAILAGPGGSVAIARCTQKRGVRFSGYAASPHVVGITSDLSGRREAWIWSRHDLVRSVSAENSISERSRYLAFELEATFLVDRVTQLVDAGVDGVILRRDDRCARLRVGEGGEGRTVPCPPRWELKQVPTEESPRLRRISP